MTLLAQNERRVWTRQPQQIVGVNKSNPIANGLGGLFDARFAVDLLTGVRATTDTATRVVSKSGVAAVFSGTNHQEYPSTPQNTNISALSLFVLFEANSLTNYSPLIAKQASGTTYNEYEFRLGNSPTDSKLCNLASDGAGHYVIHALSANAITAGLGTAQSVGYTRNSGLLNGTATAEFYANGLLQSSRSDFVNANPGNTAASNGSPVWLGRRSDGVTQFDGLIYYAAVWNRILLAQEFASLARNPWQLFASRRTRRYISLGAGGTTPKFRSRTISGTRAGSRGIG